MKITHPVFAAVLLAFAPPPLLAQEQAGSVAAPAQQVAPAIYAAEVVARHPHDPAAYTQGLLWRDGALYESTGQEGQSQVRRVDPATGKVLASQPIPPAQFGEGLALWQDELISLTWRDGVIHRWKAADLSHVSSVPYPWEGWGLTSDGASLIASDGTATLRFLDPETYALARDVQVTLNGRPLRQLNELEYIDGLIYANVWMTPYIVAVDPADGTIRRIVDLSTIVAENPSADSNAVLNGIAWDADGQRLFVTGKRWQWLYEIRLVEQP